jgi:regulatory protein
MPMAFARKTAKKKEPLGEAGLYEHAIKALGRHMRTEMELRRLLMARAEQGARGEAVVKDVMARLKEHGYLNDQSFAETYARLRQENEKLGARRVRQNLRQKGVRAEVVEQAVEARYGQANEEALARQYLSRKRIPKPESPKGTARVMRRLVTAGFSTGTIYKLLRNWDVPDEELAALENIDTETNGE